MAANTRDSIKRLADSYMSNPNAIILCIQGLIPRAQSPVSSLVFCWQMEVSMPSEAMSRSWCRKWILMANERSSS